MPLKRKSVTVEPVKAGLRSAFTTKYFKYPFAIDGDKTPISNTVNSDGTASYQLGWTLNYSEDPTSAPDALAVSRVIENQALFDITNNLKLLQENGGIPNFITSADNGGAAFSYNAGVSVLYDAGSGQQVYESLVNGNTAVPGDTSGNWGVVTAVSDTALYIKNPVFDSTVVTGDVVAFNPVSNTYQKALSNGSTLAKIVGIADVENLRILIKGIFSYASPTFTAGLTYYLDPTITGALTSTSPLPNNNGVLVGYALSTTKLFLAPQELQGFSALFPSGMLFEYAGGSVPSGFLLCDGSAISRTTYAALFASIGTDWGVGDGATTFNVPDFRRRVSVGSGGSATSVLGNIVGNVGGAETHTLTTAEMPAHSHTVPIGGDVGSPAFVLGGEGIQIRTQDTSMVGGGSAFTVMQPSAVVTKIIKF